MASLSLAVNGGQYTADVDPQSPLLYLLIHNLQLNGPKFGCGLAQCGACTVLLDGKPIRSCVTPMSSAANHEVLRSRDWAQPITRIHCKQHSSRSRRRSAPIA